MSGGVQASTAVSNVYVRRGGRGIAENGGKASKRGTSFLRVLRSLRVLRDAADLTRVNALLGSHQVATN